LASAELIPLTLALAGFVAGHVIPALPGVRRVLVAALGEKPYLLAYSLVSLGLLAWVIVAYRAAPLLPLWPLEDTLRWIPLTVMPVSCLLAVVGLTTPNPFSLGPGRKGFDPARPGILRLTRHPVLWAFILWAGAHIPPNGDAAGVMLFGVLFALSLFGLFALDAKRRRALGKDWEALSAYAPAPLRQIVREIGWGRISGGLALYVVLLGAHETLFGVAPIIW